MEISDILNYLSIGSFGLAGSGIVYLTTLFGIQNFFGGIIFHKRIESQKELENIVEKEAKELCLDSSIIDSKLCFGGFTQVQKRGLKYIIKINKDENPTVSFVRHELYHIYKGDCEKKENMSRYLFIEEPRAALYGCFKIKI